MKINNLIIFLLAVVAYSASLANGFAFDDQIIILDNPGVYSIGRSLNYFTHAVFPGDLYRPLTMLSYAANYQLGGAAGFHLINILLHGIVSCLLFYLALEFVSKKPAFVFAAFFAVLPIHSEAVANIVGRAELLSSLFVLASLLFFLYSLKSSQTKNLLLSALLLFCGLLSKESAVVAILLYPLLAYYKDVKIKQVQKAIPFVLVTLLLWASLRALALGSLLPEASQTAFIDNPLFEKSFFERLPASLSILGRYLGLSLLPVKLSADYSYPALVPFKYEFVESISWLLVAVLGIIGAALGVRKKHLSGLLLTWFFLAFAVTANVLIPIGTIMGERLAYLPSVGAAGLLTWLVLQINYQTLMKTVFLVICLSFGLICHARAMVWKNNETLHTSQIAVMPLSAKTQLNYAMLMLEKQRFEEADLHARKALELYPKYAHAAWGLGEIYFQRGVLSGATNWFQKAQGIDSKHADSMLGLARVALAKGDLVQAEKLFKKTSELKPSSFEADLGMLAIYINKAQWKEAEDLAKRLKAWNPNHAELNRYIAIMKQQKAKN